jgi:hypothetical protein
MTDILIALPTARDLPGFGSYEAGSIKDSNVRVKAVRKSDGLILDVELFGCTEEANANRIFASFEERSAVHLLQTSWSGRKLAQKVIRSNYSDDPMPNEVFSIILQDRRAIVHVRMTGPFRRDAQGELVRDAKGELISYYFTNADLLYAENIGR